jgi:endonuclease YncB( thermonuclease family)
MGWGTLIVAGAVAGTAFLAGSEAVAESCTLAPMGAGKVATVTDGRSFHLDDGRAIRLAALETPFVPIAGDDPAASAGLAAKTALESILYGQVVTLRWHGPATTDRYGRTFAYAFVTRDGAEQSVAHQLLALGLARVGIPAGEPACAASLFAQERAARAAKLGLWSEPYYELAGAESADALLAERGQFKLVEGRVASVRESGGTIYINFGRRWSEALTVTILKRHERTFAAAGVAPKQLENRVVRVRGWVEERNGPRIEAVRPEQIEIAERN